MLRSRPARHFRLLCRYEEVVGVLAVLAATRGVEVMASGADGWDRSAPLRTLLDAYADLAERYRAYWPRPTGDVPRHEQRPVELAEQALAALRGWQVEAEPIVEKLARSEREIADGNLQTAWLTALHDSAFDPRLQGTARPGFAVRVLLLPLGTHLDTVPGTLQTSLVGHGSHFIVILGNQAALEQAQQRAETLHGRLFQPAATAHDRDT